jgi:MYXO-CTERM domain-containing protein
MPHTRMSIAAIAALAAGTASSQVSDPLITINASSSLGAGSVSFTSGDVGAIAQPNGGIVFLLFAVPLDIIDQNNNNIIGTITQLSVVNNADSTDTPNVQDALTSIGFAAFAGAEDTTFNLTASFINTGSVLDAALRATAGMTVTDNNANGATLTGGGAGGSFFNAAYNGGTTFADLVAGPFNAAPAGSNSGAQDFPAAPGAFDSIANPLTDIQAQFNFTLSANDSASGTSGFFSIPTPASATLIALGGLAGLRRRR